MTRAILAAALLFPFAASATFVTKAPGAVEDWEIALVLCQKVEDDLICMMKYAPSEGLAMSFAERALEECESLDKTEAVCARRRAYIKQRWGIGP
jgi:hypothetical protein